MCNLILPWGSLTVRPKCVSIELATLSITATFAGETCGWNHFNAKITKTISFKMNHSSITLSFSTRHITINSLLIKTQVFFKLLSYRYVLFFRSCFDRNRFVWVWTCVFLSYSFDLMLAVDCSDNLTKQFSFSFSRFPLCECALGYWYINLWNKRKEKIFYSIWMQVSVEKESDEHSKQLKENTKISNLSNEKKKT